MALNSAYSCDQHLGAAIQGKLAAVGRHEQAVTLGDLQFLAAAGDLAFAVTTRTEVKDSSSQSPS